MTKSVKKLLRQFTKAWAVLGMATICCGLATSSFGSTKLEQAIQKQLDLEIKDFLSDQLARGEYFVVVEANIDPKEEDAGEVDLPYSISIPKGRLRKIIEDNLELDEQERLRLQVTIGFDERLPEQKRNLLSEVITKKFQLNTERRSINVQVVPLVTEAIRETEKFQLEKARIKSENERLQLEAQRTLLSLQQKELEFQQYKAEMDGKLKEAEKKVEIEKIKQVETSEQKLNEEDPDEALTQIQLSPAYNLAKDFQLAGMLTIIGIILLAGIVFSGVFFLKGMNPLADAINSVGGGIESMAAATVEAATKNSGLGPDGASPDAGPDSGTQDVTVDAEKTELSDEEREFIGIVRDKIDVLTRDKNFNFIRVFSDMLDRDSGTPLASAVLLTLDGEAAKILIDQIPVEQIARLRDYLASDDGLYNAKALQYQALSAMYGKIAMDEFSSSPLKNLKDVSWLTRMSTKEMSKFAVSLAEDERAAFLAALSPERTKLLIKAAENEQDRSSMISSLSKIQSVSPDRVIEVMSEVSTRMDSMQTTGLNKNSAVNAAKYLADVASELSGEDQEKLVSMVKEDALLKEMKEHFVPFSSIKTLPKSLITEIFSTYNDDGIALILFAAPAELRDHILRNLSELRAAGVQDGLKALDDDKFYQPRNLKKSYEAQKSIANYLQKLNAEGLLDGANETNVDPNLGAPSAA